MKQKYNGFTLIELMVSVALMLIIIGMTMVIFNSTSTTFTVAEAKVDIMQNARLALDTIAKDIANATAISGNTIIINNDRHNLDNIPSTLLTVTTITNWMSGNTKVTGKAQVKYGLTLFRNIDGARLYYLNRIIYPESPTTPNTYPTPIDINSSILAEYLIDTSGNNSSLALFFEYFMHSGTSNTDWNGPYSQDTIANSDLPPLVRVTITVTDEFRTACRTLSRMIWIPKGIRRP